jgi:hypothetical protein
MSNRGGAGAGGSAAEAARVAKLFADKAPAPAAPTTTFALSPDAEAYLVEHSLLMEPLKEARGTAATQFEQLPTKEREELVNNTVRYVVMSALGGAGVVRAAEVASAVKPPGKYPGCDAIKGPFLIQRAVRRLADDFGITLAPAYKTLSRRESCARWRRRGRGCGGGLRASPAGGGRGGQAGEAPTVVVGLGSGAHHHGGGLRAARRGAQTARGAHPVRVREWGRDRRACGHTKPSSPLPPHPRPLPTALANARPPQRTTSA